MSDTIVNLRKTLMIMQDEIDRLKSPPYCSATVIDLGKETARISVDGGEILEIPIKEVKDVDAKRGDRVRLNPMSKAIVGKSEFADMIGEVAIVEEIFGNRLKVKAKDEPHIVINSYRDIKVGDEVVLDPSKAIVIEKFSKKKTKYALEEIPVAPWSDIGGLENVLTKIRQEVEEPFIYKDLFAKYGRKPVKGILLYGPPGCGKTMIGKSIAYNLSQLFASKNGGKKSNGHFIKINGPEILDKWVGNSEATIRRVYESARDVAAESESPVVVFVDEAEAVLKTRGSGVSSDVYDSIVPQFLAEMDGLNGHSNIITILATNREDILDPAILRDGRVDRRICISRPTKDGAKEIFKIYLKDKPLQQDLKDVEQASNRLAKEIYDDKMKVYSVVNRNQEVLGNFLYRHLVSGAVIKGIVDRASNYAIQREIKKGKAGISLDDLNASIKDELAEQGGFNQALVKEDWEDVFGSKAGQYHRSYEQGYIVLENLLKSDSTKSKGGKTK